MSIKVGSMLQDVLQSLVKTPVTQRYPYTRTTTPPRLRGLLVWEGNECIGCTLCAKDCPAQALEVITLDKKAKRFVVRYHVDRCTFCAQCVESCRRGCLKMSDDWELATFSKQAFELYYGKPEDVQAFLDRPIETPAE